MRGTALKTIASVLSRITDPREMHDVLRGILTEQEGKRIGLRWRILELLARGESQRGIAQKLGVSLCNITRGSRELKRGPRRFRSVVERSAKKTTKGG
jgi:TrpR family trp operon transcriptional repressor